VENGKEIERKVEFLGVDLSGIWFWELEGF
jgi:hypothetical protein